MMINKSFNILFIFAIIALTFTACGEGETATSEQPSKGKAMSKNSAKGGYAGKNLFEPPVGLITPMGKNSNTVFNEGTQHYAKKDYDQAIEVWNTIYDRKGTNDTLQFYLGAAHVAKSEYDLAIPYLVKARNVHRSKFYELSNWYLGVCHYKTGNFKLAKQSLEKTTTPLKARLLNEMQ